MPQFCIGKYRYSASPNFYHIYSNKKTVKGYDRRLYKSLKKIFHEDCSSSSSSSQFKKFRRDPQHDSDWKSMINSILEQEPVFSKYLSIEELGELDKLLWVSVLAGYEKSAELLVRSGANVSEPFGRREPQVIDEKWTVLHVLLQSAPSSEKKRLAYLVIDHGAKLQAQDYKERTVLHYAVVTGLVLMTQTLLEKGAEANAADVEGITPLFIAVRQSKTRKLVSLLIKHGADLQARDYMGRTVLHYSVRDERVQMTEILLDNGVDVNAADDRGMTSLFFAASSSKFNKLVPLLVKHGADVCARSRSGQTALHYFTRALVGSLEPTNAVEVARFLIERGVPFDDNSCSNHHHPIHFAAQTGIHELVKLYLDRGANVNALTKCGVSPLYMAAQSDANCSSTVDILLKRGANVNQRICKGRTALHAACEYAAQNVLRNDGSVIKLLVSAGANMLVEDDNGITPISYMVRSHMTESACTKLMVRLLALNKACQPLIELQEERFIERYPELQNYYRICMDEIDRMRFTRFIVTCSFFELLAKSHHQIANLMRNPDFEIMFKRYDLNEFSNYAEDIRQAFEIAQNYYQPMLDHENIINEAFYDMLPHAVVGQMVHCILDDDY